VADIDETILDNREEFSSHPDFKWSEFEAWMQRAEAPLLKPTADFLSWARGQGYAIFLVTGRREKDRAATIQNLVRRGVDYDGLYMRPDNYKGAAAEVMKTAHRDSIEKMGFKIVVNIGDQFSDLYGGKAEECVKLPNKMYYIP
jgi:acid phosphatase